MHTSDPASNAAKQRSLPGSPSSGFSAVEWTPFLVAGETLAHPYRQDEQNQTPAGM